jgi:calcium/calmodulin-dependent protein kinase (CaM kinase) II
MDLLRTILEKVSDVSNLVEISSLGEGGFGRVSKCQSPDGSLVALKVANPNLLFAARPEERGGLIKSFFREIFTQIKAVHPSVVPLYGWSVYNGITPRFCMVMPAYSHGTLKQHYNDLSPIQKTIIAYGIARGMRELHTTFGIIHRDLKPENVFLDEQFRPIIADLGLAKGDTGALQSAAACTPLFAAPEVLRGMGPSEYGTKVDVFSYAVSIACMVEGSDPVYPPGTFKNKKPTAHQIREVLERGIRPCLNRATPDLKAWIDCLWATDPSRRPPFTEICARMESKEGWFDGADADSAAFDAYRAELDAAEAEHAAKEPEGPTWLRELQESETFSFELFESIIDAAGSGDYEAQKFAAVIYAAGFKDWVKQSKLLAARFAAIDPVIAGLRSPGAYACPFDQGAILEGSDRLEEAASKYREAAERGNVDALWRWGALLVRNDSGLHFEEGLTLLRAADELGSVDAAFELGMLYKEGMFVEPDDEKAIGYFKKALDGGHADAAITLGKMYHEKLDFAEAYAYYGRAFDEYGVSEADALRTTLLSQGWVSE